MIDEKKLINYIKTEINPYGRPFKGTVFEFGCKVMDYIVNMDKVDGWIPFKERKANDEEREAYGCDAMLTGKFPDEDKDILVTYASGRVGFDTFLREGYECYLDSGAQFVSEAIAWMPLPEPYNQNTCKSTECPFYCSKQDCIAKEECDGYTDEPLDPEWKRNFMNRFTKSEV